MERVRGNWKVTGREKALLLPLSDRVSARRWPACRGAATWYDKDTTRAGESPMDQAFNEAAVMPDATAMETVREAVRVYNDDRPRQENGMHWLLLVIMGAYGVAAFIIFIWIMNQEEKGNFGIVIGLVGAAGWGLYQLCMKPVRDFQQGMRNRMLPQIFGFIDGVRYSKGLAPRFMDKFPKKALLSYGQAQHDDAISGHYDGLSFMLSETKLLTGGKNAKTLFQGVIFHFYLEQPFPGILAAAKRPTGMQKFAQDFFGTGDLRIIESGDVMIDATHEFRTDNRSAALPLIKGSLVQALDYLGDVWRDDVVRIALVDNACFLLVPTRKNFFELPDIAHDINIDRHVLPMIRDIVTLLVTARLVSRINVSEQGDTSAR